MGKGLNNVKSLSQEQPPQAPQTTEQSTHLAWQAVAAFIYLKIDDRKINRTAPCFVQTLFVVEKRDRHFTAMGMKPACLIQQTFLRPADRHLCTDE